MAIGKRIRFFRGRKGMKQKQLGEALGFSDRTSEVRITQYESETRVPKEDLLRAIAGALDVSEAAIKVPDIDTYIGLMHTLFALEDMYGLTVDSIDGCTCLRLKYSMETRNEFDHVGNMLDAWLEQAQLLREEKISKEEYDSWRYHYPEKDTHNRWAKVPPADLGKDLI